MATVSPGSAIHPHEAAVADHVGGQNCGEATFHTSSPSVARARKNRVQPHPSTGIAVGVDCGRGGRGKTRMYDRQGRRLGGHINITLDTDDLMQVAGVCAQVIDALRQKDLPFRQWSALVTA